MIKMCKEHWKKCVDAVKSKGLWHLVSENIDELTNKITDDQDKRAYDPLFNLSFMIAVHAIECSGGGDCGGSYLMSDDEDDDMKFFCPLCEAVKKTGRENMDDNWIDGAMKEVYEQCVDLSIQG